MDVHKCKFRSLQRLYTVRKPTEQSNKRFHQQKTHIVVSGNGTTLLRGCPSPAVVVSLSVLDADGAVRHVACTYDHRATIVGPCVGLLARAPRLRT